jgi:hypothetical protein
MGGALPWRAPDGTHLGSLLAGGLTSNVGWGGDGSDLHVSAGTAVRYLRLAARGCRPWVPAREGP